MATMTLDYNSINEAYVDSLSMARTVKLYCINVNSMTFGEFVAYCNI